MSFNQPLVGGAAAMPVPVPCDLGLVGGMLEVQWWVIGTSSSPCPIVSNLSFSNRLQAKVGL